MGLDMFMYAQRSGQSISEDVPVAGATKVEEKYEIGYWRKHNQLHGYMAETFGSNGRMDNCEEIYMSMGNLLQMRAYFESAKEMTSTNGFFFGAADDTYDEDQREYDLKIIDRAIEFILLGDSEDNFIQEEDNNPKRKYYYSVYYTADW